MTIEEKYVEHVARSFVKAEALESKITQEIKDIEGMTGEMTRHFYNNLLELPDARYLEVGVWKGSSSCAVLCGNKAEATLIDDFSGFLGPRDEFMANLGKFRGANDVTFLASDCFSVNPEAIGKFNIYLFDGDHSRESHRKAIVHFLSAMDEVFILVVDDWNWPEVRVGTMNGITESNLRIISKHEIRLTENDLHTQEDPTLEPGTAERTWWNGIAVFILKKPC